ncbi:SulP family inorganic anion transporter [Nakamurella lactea]|uniref:SulP family inorganic anion transporter n=1 Tax=Nakamurella lactea TaxID=459515 RepID=UPI0003FE0F93|nr:SulP family inorganic anion transporter [Nakamurella lactea]
MRWRGWLPRRDTVLKDLLAGLPGAISSVPDGMASGLLAGVSPVNGLYASAAGPIAGGLTSSTQLMVVATTGAAALATGSALGSVAPGDRPGALVLISLFAGIAMIAAAVLRLGRYTRFVSHSVMTGFLTGVAANIVFGQIPDLTGSSASGGFALAKALSVLGHPTHIDLPSLLTGVAAGALVVLLARTRLAAYGALLAVAVPTAVVAMVKADSVARVQDSGAIPRGFPLPALPDFSQFSFSLVGGALAVAAIVLVQGAGVAEVAPNPDGSRSSTDRNFLSQGVANVASSLVKGQPVGGSLGQTALNVTSGARTRWAAVFSGLWMLVILIALSGLVGIVAQPTLAALLIVAAIGSISPARVITIFRTGATSQVAMVSTFIATLLLPVATAVGFGVALSLLLQLNREALDLRIVRLVPTDAGWRVREPPKSLGDREVVALDVYGSLLYAGSRTLQTKLPDPAGSHRTAVIIRLRGRTELGATFFLVIDQYAGQLQEAGGRLFLSGVDPELRAQHRRNRGPEDRDRITVSVSTDLVGESTDAAFAQARRWVDADQDGGNVHP